MFQGSIYTALGKGKMANPTLGRLHLSDKTVNNNQILKNSNIGPFVILREVPTIPDLASFYRRLSEPQDQSGHEGAKKILHPSDTRDRTRAVQACSFSLEN